jgi:hypothetical protein
MRTCAYVLDCIRLVDARDRLGPCVCWAQACNQVISFEITVFKSNTSHFSTAVGIQYNTSEALKSLSRGRTGAGTRRQGSRPKGHESAIAWCAALHQGNSRRTWCLSLCENIRQVHLSVPLVRSLSSSSSLRQVRTPNMTLQV